jgi:signal transduction histidine kinase/ligand-binding sensor domain-containing protein
VSRFVAGDPARVEFYFYPDRHGSPPPTVHAVCEDLEGNLWICTPRGLALFQEASAGRAGQFTIQLKRDVSSEGNYLLSIRPHPDGGLWLLTQNALSRFYAGRVTPYLEQLNNPGSAAGLTETATGEVIFSFASDRLFQSGRAPGAAVEHKLAAESKPAQAPMFPVYALCVDREGNIWAGAIGDGLLRLSRRRVTMLQPISFHPEASGGPILEDSRGDFWFGTHFGLSRLSAGALITLFTRDAHRELGDWSVDALYQDAAGDVWIGKTNGVARYRAGRFTQYLLPGVRQVQAICEDRQGQLWLGTWQGLARFHDGSVTIYRQPDGLINDNVQFIMEDRAGALWLGTPEGLSRFQDGRFTNYTTSTGTGEGLSNNYVRAIHEDPDGTLWIGTYGGGLNRLRNGRIAHITARQGLFDDFISRIIPSTGDEDDTFWMLGNRGIFQVSRRALNEVADGQRQALTCVVYDKADGMDPSEGQGGVQPAGWRARDGRLYFPTIRGVAVLDPRLTNLSPPPVHIERVLLESAELDARRPIEIPPGRGNLEIHYTGLSLSKPELVQFSYHLSGEQEEWVDVGTRRAAYFPRLSPGDYRFSVKALSPAGVWSVQAAGLRIVVKPHFWQTLWFRLAESALAVGLLVLGYRQRIAIYRRRATQQEAFTRELLNTQEAERKRIAAELHDGLGQNLLTINNWARLGLKNLPPDNPAQTYLNEVAETTALTLEEVRQIARNLRPAQLERLGLTNTLEHMLHSLARASGIAFSVELDNIDGCLSPDAEINLYRVVQECANNIVKHSGASSARLTIKRSASGLDLCCEDNGRGFALALDAQLAASPTSHGSGLRWMWERVNLLGGTLTIRSAPDAGTTILISIACASEK